MTSLYTTKTMSHDKLIGYLELREAVDLDDNSLC